jgi:hypothetical protein
MKKGDDRPYPKVYSPARHYAENDEIAGKNFSDVAEQLGLLKVAEKRDFLRNLQQTLYAFSSLFLRPYKTNDVYSSPHRQLNARSGIHPYICCAVKKNTYEITAYYNPEAYAPEYRGISILFFLVRCIELNNNSH